MAICVVSPCSSRYSQNLIKTEVVVNNESNNRSSVSASPIINNKTKTIRCRFTCPGTTPNHGYLILIHIHASSFLCIIPVAVGGGPGRRCRCVWLTNLFKLVISTWMSGVKKSSVQDMLMGQINIPYLHTLGSGMTKNTDFIAQMSSRFNKDDEILIACQIGKRSLMAANDLLAAGYTGVMEIAGGYAAWIQSELPAQV